MSSVGGEEILLSPSTSVVKEEEDGKMVIDEEFMMQEENNINLEDFIKKEENGIKEKIDPYMDPSWSSSISEPQMDLLVYLKHIALLKTKNTCTMGMTAKLFNEKMLRALGSILTTYLKERLLDSSEIDGFPSLLSEHERYIRSESSIKDRELLKRKRT
ncbi:hypothetical protein ZOSMA_125G00620 [Zostera marina]|uniref:Uncharacterized protein n=1 Tax=Zostera marina TaxID=29655 RepID=A0A0K9Q0C9_ZOSMR|nr:hypothetical protein ZOSMA_125G00620 [Zostera marina]